MTTRYLQMPGGIQSPKTVGLRKLERLYTTIASIWTCQMSGLSTQTLLCPLLLLNSFTEILHIFLIPHTLDFLCFTGSLPSQPVHSVVSAWEPSTHLSPILSLVCPIPAAFLLFALVQIIFYSVP